MKNVKHAITKDKPRGGGRHRGYVLVVTLGLLVLAASLMVAVSRGALRHQTAARLAADELQHRWAVVSVRNATLPYAESILAIEEAERHRATLPPLPLFRTQLRLAGETLEVTVADEQAKANVNLLLDHADRMTAETRLTAGLSSLAGGLHIRLRPAGSPLPAATTKASATQPAAVAQAISGFGQIFENPTPQMLMAQHGDWRLADLLTCWGTGQVNLRRISPEALGVAGGSLTAIERGRLIKARDDLFSGRGLQARLAAGAGVDSDPIRRVVAAAGLNSRNARGVPAFTGISACYSVWIIADDGRRSSYYFSVRDESEKEHPKTAAMVW
jgi:hypothetical protein